MLKKLPLRIFIVILIPLTACKAWYKVGADEEELTTNQQRCEDETNTSEGKMFVECMERAGWHHSDMSATSTHSKTDSPAVVEVEAKAPASQHKTPLPAITVNPAVVENEAKSPADQHQPHPTNINEVKTLNTTNASELSNAEEKLIQPRRIRGWIQFGEDANQLKDDKAQCYDADMRSEPFQKCMREKGWHPLGIRITVEEPGDFD